MIKQIKSSDIKKFIESNPETVLLDVRTEDEWNSVGKPDTKKFWYQILFYYYLARLQFFRECEAKY